MQYHGLMHDFNAICQDLVGEEKTEWYTEGSCHLLARAFFDLMQWPVGVFVQSTASTEPEWDLHAFALLPVSISERLGYKQQMVLDVTGLHTLDDLKQEWHCQDYEVLSCTEQIQRLMALWETWHDNNAFWDELPTQQQQNAWAVHTAGQMLELLSRFFSLELTRVDSVSTLV